MMRATITLRTNAREELIDVTERVRATLRMANAGDGVVTLFVPHTTAAITVNENADPAVQRDMIGWLARLVPHEAPFAHAEGNSDAHIKASLVGPSVQVPFVSGRMLLGQWQGIYFCEFDGPRERQLEAVFA
ncbi:MAG: YjbQ family protein [Dehalococcoidia bacterium]|nr:YjbQ family protein [Dehalococcoidia bacterium]